MPRHIIPSPCGIHLLPNLVDLKRSLLGLDVRDGSKAVAVALGGKRTLQAKAGAANFRELGERRSSDIPMFVRNQGARIPRQPVQGDAGHGWRVCDLVGGQWRCCDESQRKPAVLLRLNMPFCFQ